MSSAPPTGSIPSRSSARAPGARLNVGLFNLGDRSYIRWADTAAIGDDAPARFTQPGFNAGATLSIEL